MTRPAWAVRPLSDAPAPTAKGLFVAGSGPATGKSAVALGLHQLLARRIGRLGVFRPMVLDPDRTDPVVDLLRGRGADHLPYEASLGVSYDDVHADEDRALEEIVARYRAVATECDAVIVVGSDFTDVGAPTELAFNARVAVNLGLPVVCVVSGQDRSLQDVQSAADIAREALAAEGCIVVEVVANRVAPEQVDDLRAAFARRVSGPPVSVMPEVPTLMAPTVGEAIAGCGAHLIAGEPDQLGREASRFLVAAMTLPNLLERLTDGVVVLTPGDRADILAGMVLASTSRGHPAVAGIVLTGGLPPAEPMLKLVKGLTDVPPVALTDRDTYETAARADSLLGRLSHGAPRKVDTALALFEACVDGGALLERVAVGPSPVVTPLMFEHRLLERAREDRRHIVLAEGGDDRVLRAAEILLRRRVVDLTLLGEEEQVRGAAARLGLDLTDARVVDPSDAELCERFAQHYATARAHKGVTVEQARDVVTDVSYFATLMIAVGLADGMVSGAAHTTAQTIRPSMELLRSGSGATVVSSVFFMCLSDRVLVYGDCAVNPEPTAEQLADIAVASARTAARFGVEPRVAMLSYSTGESGAGAGVDRVRRATGLVRAQAPELSVEGPIQYDAAVDAGVAAAKLPESSVAGRATVFIFPDLNTGNNTYKAVQRSAGAVAVGPVLQGLRRPVNDLSRGATVHDIVNTVAITAIQAGT